MEASSQQMAHPLINHARMNSARYFQRREDYAPRKTHDKSAFNLFIVYCLKCDSYDVKPDIARNEETGEDALALTCKRCKAREFVKV